MAEENTEEQIFEAARSVFHEQGYGGARMQEIARRAGINQSMLHYYFRSKAKLFDAVFSKAVSTALPPVLAILKSDLPLFRKIETFVSNYLDVVYSNPHLPSFILEELRRNPDRIHSMVSSKADGIFPVFESQVDNAVTDGSIRPISAHDLFANMIAMCVFPIVARPMLQGVMGKSDSEYDDILRGRKEHVTGFLLTAIRT